MGSILVDFERKLEKQQYVSLALFNKTKKRAPEHILKRLALDQYNDEILNSLYEKNRDYFNSSDSDLSLSKEQIKAILADEKHKLIIVNSNTERNATIVAQVNYLVRAKHISPNALVVLAGDEWETNILHKRIESTVGATVDVATIHSLGYRHIRQILRYKNSYIVDEEERDRIFLKYLKKRIITSYAKTEDFIGCFNNTLNKQEKLIGDYFSKNYGRFANFDDYFESYLKDYCARTTNFEARLKRLIRNNISSSAPRTMIGERVKNKNEAIIANWLFSHSINYRYAEPFDDMLFPDTKTHRPDFTIEIGGRKIYIKYLDTKDSESNAAKENFHRKNNTEFVVLSYEPKCAYLNTLRRELEKLGIHLPRERSARELCMAITKRNPLVEFRGVKNLFFETIDSIKTSPDRNHPIRVIDEYLDKIKDLDERIISEKQYKYIRDFFGFYNSEIHRDADKLGFDSADMIYYAKSYIDNSDAPITQFKYIIVGEGIDEPPAYHELIGDIIARSKAHTTIVGSSWRDIYTHTRSNFGSLCLFRDSIKDLKTFYPSLSPNQPDQSIDTYGELLTNNLNQNYGMLRRAMIQKGSDPFVFLNYDTDDEPTYIKKAILSLQQQRPNDKILILATSNAAIDKMVESSAGFTREGSSKISLTEAPNHKYPISTIGNEKDTIADWIIVVGLADERRKRSRDSYRWLANLFTAKPETKNYAYWERLLLCAALTHVRYKVILPRNIALPKRNTFIDELYALLRERGPSSR